MTKPHVRAVWVAAVCAAISAAVSANVLVWDWHRQQVAIATMDADFVQRQAILHKQMQDKLCELYTIWNEQTNSVSLTIASACSARGAR